jgi:two-component system chemotaxis sensor kinase CheA
VNFDMSEFQSAFFEEAVELLDDFEAGLLRLEDHADDPELINMIFRCAHSIKGGSATFGLPEIAQFTHGLETLLDKGRDRKIGIDREVLQVLFESLDHLKSLFDAARSASPQFPQNEALVGRLASLAELEQPGGSQKRAEGAKGAAKSYRLLLTPGESVLRQGADVLLLLQGLSRDCSSFVACCDTSHVPGLASLDPEASYLSWEIELSTELSPEAILDHFEFIADESRIELAEVGESVNVAPVARATVEASGKQEGATLRVSAEKLDRLINLVGELVINQSMLTEVTDGFTISRLPRLYEAVSAMERASRELQERAMAIRLVPIRHAFSRFPRLVRDLAAACGKSAELRTSGEDTELDKTLIEAIADPLTHLVRNSVDHGLECADERRSAGKQETGTVRLRALQEGGTIVIEVADDGRGLNRDKILAKAQERGLIAAQDQDLSDEQVFACIFEPGFSTASQVTDVSGRGVGMDIVRQALRAVNGSIGLASEPGKGTTFRIRLPLTMAILEGLSLAVGDEVYLLPLTSIVESIQPKQQDIHMLAGGREVVRVRGEVLPLLRLYAEFGAKPKITNPAEGLLVIVENDGRRVALLVDELIGQSQVVIKSVETNHRKVDGIAGATILGDGRVALILDVPQLLRVQEGSRPVAA